MKQDGKSSTESLVLRIAEALHKIGLAAKQQTWLASASEGVSATQGQILALLVSQGAVSSSQLARKLGVSLPTVSDSVRALVEKGFVVKNPGKGTPRGTSVTLTASGRGLGKRARAWPEFMAEAATELSPVEQAAFYSGVVKMIRNLQEQGLVPMGGMCVNCVHFRPYVYSENAPHHCALIDEPLRPSELRIDCPEHELVTCLANFGPV